MYAMYRLFIDFALCRSFKQECHLPRHTFPNASLARAAVQKEERKEKQKTKLGIGKAREQETGRAKDKKGKWQLGTSILVR